MRQIGSIEVQIPRVALLEALKKNRDSHKAIVAEAREGYVKAARQALVKRMAELDAGKIVTLGFNLSVPVDMTKEYSTVIGMLEMSQEETITLSSAEYRCLVEDAWDWQNNFLMSNSHYSVTASRRITAGSADDE